MHFYKRPLVTPPISAGKTSNFPSDDSNLHHSDTKSLTMRVRHLL